MNNLIEKLNAMISEDQEMLSLLPKNNKNDIDEYLKKVLESRRKYKKIRKEIADEVKVRYHLIRRKGLKPEVVEIKKNLKQYNDLFLLDNSNTTYQKMGLDKFLYNLKHFYKSYLNLVNTDILDCVNAFKNCNINLTAKDFQYNEFTYRYMTTFFEEAKNDTVNSDKIKDTFEEVYWKCPDIIKNIWLNIEYLYIKNKREIDKFYKTKTEELTKVFNKKSSEITQNFLELKEQFFNEYNKDEFLILNKFLNNELDINRYSYNEIKSEYSKIVKNDIENLKTEELDVINDNIYKLSNTLYEYKNYLKYSNIISDMKKRFSANEKVVYNIDKDLKEISSIEAELMKANNKIKKCLKPQQKLMIFGSKNTNEKVEEFYKLVSEKINKLEELYNKLHESILNEQINKLVSSNSTIYELLCFASSHYSYFCKCLSKQNKEDNVEESNKEKEFDELKEFLSNPQFNVLIKNLRILEDKKIEQIIRDRYFLFHIEIPEEDLKQENLEDFMQSMNKIVMYNNIKNSTISYNDIKFMCELKRVCQK